MDRFGEKLQALRARRRLTLEQFARVFDYRSTGYLSELESGKKKPTAEFVLRVSRYFGVTTDALMKDELDLPGSAS